MNAAAASLIVVLAIALATAGCVRPSHATAPAPLRVCADPNNLPFTNDRGEGFENRLAELLARDLGTSVTYTWWAQRRGFLRNTLDAGRCDVVMGLPTRVEMALTTRPYYRSTYVFVTRRASRLRIRSFDDRRLRVLRIGVPLVGDEGANAPPAHALASRGIVRNVVGYTVYGDYRTSSPPSSLIAAVAHGEVDVAVAWGPLAGYFGPRQAEALEVVPVAPQTDAASVPQVFDISMAVRRRDERRRERLDDFIRRRRAEIDGILAGFHVPRAEPALEEPF
jgi:mxaJ protein